MSTYEEAKSRLCVALDVPSREEAEAIVNDIGSFVGTFKIGMELFTAEGPEIVRRVHELGGSTFLDLKYHDIPNTVAGAARAATRMGVKLFDVHASGGRAMMEAAANAVREEATRLGIAPPKVLAVTVLTSLSAGSLVGELNVIMPLADQVTHLALLAQSSGVDDQERVTTPREAIEMGADYIVVGRPITKSDQRQVATKKILREMLGS